MADYIANRYLLEDMLGKGGMGAVWRASDRLSGQQVALKRVNVAASRDKSKDTLAYRLALALEFRILASLRHPHIMSVLDYGFDRSAQPFYTMTLLENAQPMTDYAEGITDESELVRLTIDLLEAIAYLHRRDLIHRDLKPQNVLVTPDGVVKVLDFGLALYTRESVSNVYEEGVGTVRYMSPELLTGDPASVQSDLYAIGVMLYQLLTGKYPYNQRNLGVLVQEIMNAPPDTSMLPTRLQRVVDRLLMKHPDYRYQQAQDVIDDLAKAINTPLRIDKRALRESYLQAARFVGRDEELRTLRTALKNTLAGAGSQWLIGGESGIGKSRLLEELRTLALVEGATVLRGQSVTGGERRFHMWLDILRQLALMVDISDDEASILKTILPNLDTLLQRETPSERSLRGVQGQQLLVRTIVAVLMRYDKPLIILLEDLHWAGNSLDVLQQLSAQAQDMPYLIVGTYRDDERPDLPVHLSEMDVMRLSRLDAMSMEQLSAAMLGTAGKQPHVLKLLQEETEGNVFFMVEIVRALAEDAGRLDAIGQQPLPQNILTGGVQQVVQRRLDRLPDTVRTWLNAVAIAGHQLDLPVVNELTDDTLDLTSTLMLCSNVAVLTVEGDSWRFAHDKIRESIINALSDTDHAHYNRQVAEAIERVYPEDDSRVAILLEHWLAAHIPDKIITYTAAGVHQMLKQGYIEDALAYAEHALPYMPDGSFARMDLYTRLGLIYRIIYNMRASQAQYKEALSLARALAHTEGLVKALCGLATVHVEMMNDLEQAQSYVDEALALSGDDIKLQEDALMAAGRVAAAMRDFDTAKAHYEASLRIHQQRGNRQRIANTLNQLGLIAMRRGDLTKAHAHLSESIAIVEEVGNYFSTTKQLQNLIDLEGWRGNFDAQRTHAKHVIALWREHNARPQMAEGYFSLAHIEMSRSDYESAREYLEKGTHIVQQTEQTMEAAWFNYGWLARLEESYTEAMLSFSKALAICTEMGNQHAQAHVLCQMGLVAFAEGNHSRAHAYTMRSWQLCEHLSDDEIALHIQILCGTLLRELNHLEMALSIHEQALAQAIESNHIQHRIAAQATLSRTLLANGQASEGKRILQAGLADAWEHHMMPYVLAILLSNVDFLHQAGQHMAAAEQLHMIAQHPAVGYVALENRMDALVLWTHLQQKLNIEAQRTAKERALYLDLAKVVNQRLGMASAG